MTESPLTTLDATDVFGIARPSRNPHLLYKLSSHHTKTQRSTRHCLYCRELIHTGLYLAGNFGVVYGHALCVETAFDSKTLILDAHRPKNRPLELKLRANRLRTLGRRKSVVWSWTKYNVRKHLAALLTRATQLEFVPKDVLHLMRSLTPVDSISHSDIDNAIDHAVWREKLGTVTGRTSVNKPNKSNLPRPSSIEVAESFPSDTAPKDRKKKAPAVPKPVAPKTMSSFG